MAVSRKVMILDDNLLDVMEVEKYLHTGGYDVVHLSSPNGAISKIEYEKPEILLLDIKMPRLNVSDLIATLRAASDLEELVIVLFSDMDAERLQQFCMDNDINGYFCKSMDVRQIAEFLNNFYEY
ncbi:MAG: response regulator [Bradymonadaceae bacterium]|nr:response regulator [Lujinxingiaceae bacterium]